VRVARLDVRAGVTMTLVLVVAVVMPFVVMPFVVVPFVVVPITVVIVVVVVVGMLPAAPVGELSNQRRQLEPVRMLVVLRNDDDSAEQAAVDAFPDVPGMVMERPGADHLAGDLEPVRPGLAGADLVRAPAVRTLRAERPGTVGVDTVAQPVQMKPASCRR
jgi:hypothetical protein